MSIHNLARMLVSANIQRAERARTALKGGHAHLDATTALLNTLEAVKINFARICGEDERHFDNATLVTEWTRVELEYIALKREFNDLRLPPRIGEFFNNIAA